MHPEIPLTSREGRNIRLQFTLGCETPLSSSPGGTKGRWADWGRDTSKGFGAIPSGPLGLRALWGRALWGRQEAGDLHLQPAHWGWWFYGMDRAKGSAPIKIPLNSSQVWGQVLCTMGSLLGHALTQPQSRGQRWWWSWRWPGWRLPHCSHRCSHSVHRPQPVSLPWVHRWRWPGPAPGLQGPSGARQLPASKQGHGDVRMGVGCCYGVGGIGGSVMDGEGWVCPSCMEHKYGPYILILALT